MSTTELLGVEELMKYRRVDSSIPRRGPKETCPDGSRQQEDKLWNLYSQQYGLHQEKRVAKLSNMSVGEWSQCKQLVEVKVERGKFWQTMGYHSGGKKYLYAEEGLFLLEMNCMELRHQGIPLTLQEAYELLIPEHFSLEHYQVFSHLMRLGYITSRHKEYSPDDTDSMTSDSSDFDINDMTDYEYRIRLHQYRHHQKKVYLKVQGWFQQMGDGRGTGMQEGGMDRYTNTLTHNSLPDGQQTSNDLSSSSFAGVSSRASNDQATGEAVASGVFPSLPGSETSSVVNNLPSQESYLYSDSSVMVQPIQRESFGASVNLLNYHKMFMQTGEDEKDRLMKRNLESSMSDSESDDKEEALHLWHPAKRRKLDLGRELIVYSDSGRDSSLKSKKAAHCPPSSEDSPGKCDQLKECSVRLQFKEDNFNKLLWPSNTLWESSDLGTSQLSCTPSVNIDDVLNTIVPMFHDGSESEAVPGHYSSWNFQTIKLPNLAKGLCTRSSPSSKRGKSKSSSTKNKGKMNFQSKSEQAEQLMKASQELLKTSAKMIKTSDEMMATCDKTASRLEDNANFTSIMKRKPPSNWGEYKKLLLEEDAENCQDLPKCPTAHLWQGDVKPLVHPKDATSTGNLLNKLQVISNANITSEHVRISSQTPNIKLAFDVFLPSSNYKKTQAGRPKFHVAVARVSDPVPDLMNLANLLQQASAISLLVAVVDDGDITFYTLKGIELPTDISIG